jgi:transposase
MWTRKARAEHARDNLRYPSDLTDAEWQILAPLFPPPARTGRHRSWPMREVINAIFFMLRGGCPWRMLPEHFPPHQTAYRRFNRPGVLDPALLLRPGRFDRWGAARHAWVLGCLLISSSTMQRLATSAPRHRPNSRTTQHGGRDGPIAVALEIGVVKMTWTASLHCAGACGAGVRAEKSAGAFEGSEIRYSYSVKSKKSNCGNSGFISVAKSVRFSYPHEQ